MQAEAVSSDVEAQGACYLAVGDAGDGLGVLDSVPWKFVAGLTV